MAEDNRDYGTVILREVDQSYTEMKVKIGETIKLPFPKFIPDTAFIGWENHNSNQLYTNKLTVLVTYIELFPFYLIFDEYTKFSIPPESMQPNINYFFHTIKNCNYTIKEEKEKNQKFFPLIRQLNISRCFDMLETFDELKNIESIRFKSFNYENNHTGIQHRINTCKPINNVNFNFIQKYICDIFSPIDPFSLQLAIPYFSAYKDELSGTNEIEELEMPLAYYLKYYKIWNLIYCTKIKLITQKLSNEIQNKIKILQGFVDKAKTKLIELNTYDTTILLVNKNYKSHSKGFVTKEKEWEELYDCYEALRKDGNIAEPIYIYESRGRLSSCSLNRYVVTARNHSSISKVSLYLLKQNQLPPYGFDNCSNLKKVFINSSFQYFIPSCTFRNCYKLEYAEFKNCEDIKREAFKGCKLTSISFPKELRKIRYKGFSECELPHTISFPYSIDLELKAFYKSNEIKIIFEGELINIGNACFAENNFLEEVVFMPSVKKLNIEKYAFKACKNLQKVDLPNSIEILKQGCFIECLNLQSISLPPSLIKIESSAFRNCMSLKKVEINGNKISVIGINAFYGCQQLTEIEIPSSIQKIELDAFDGCIKLESIIIKNKTLILNTLSVYESYDGCLYDQNYETLLIIPQGKNGILYLHKNLKHIDKRIFNYKYNIRNLEIANNTALDKKELQLFIDSCLSIK